MANSPANSSLANQLLGSWRMTSWTYEVLETGEEVDALGPDPRGWINYTPDGRMMVLVFKADRPVPASLVPTQEEKIALYDTMFAYAGTYEVEGDHVVHRIDMSWNRVWEGTEQVRYIMLDGPVLEYRSAPAKNPLDGRDCVHLVRFEKAGLSS